MASWSWMINWKGQRRFLLWRMLRYSKISLYVVKSLQDTWSGNAVWKSRFEPGSVFGVPLPSNGWCLLLSYPVMSQYGHPNNILRRVHILNVAILQFSPSFLRSFSYVQTFSSTLVLTHILCSSYWEKGHAELETNMSTVSFDITFWCRTF
jgi:hypothetical protein